MCDTLYAAPEVTKNKLALFVKNSEDCFQKASEAVGIWLNRVIAIKATPPMFHRIAWKKFNRNADIV